MSQSPSNVNTLPQLEHYHSKLVIDDSMVFKNTGSGDEVS